MSNKADQADESKASFAAYILLSEPIQFNTLEIAEALAEDYPSLEATELFAKSGQEGFDCDTDQFITAPLMMVDGQDKNTVLLVRLPGYGTWDPAAIPPRQMINCPNIKDALARNRSYICVSVSTRSDDLTDRFRAARLASCVAAVFARLPVALAAYWESGDHFLSPEAVVNMADKAVSGDWPTKEWIGQNLARDISFDPPAAQSCTNGLRHFLDYEISYAKAPVGLDEAAMWLWSTSEMALAFGNKFEDGHTIGLEGVAPKDSHLLRRAPKGFQGSEHELLVMFHPKSYANHEEMFGPHNLRPHPNPEEAYVQPNYGFFKRMLHGMRTS